MTLIFNSSFRILNGLDIMCWEIFCKVTLHCYPLVIAIALVEVFYSCHVQGNIQQLSCTITLASNITLWWCHCSKCSCTCGHKLVKFSTVVIYWAIFCSYPALLPWQVILPSGDVTAVSAVALVVTSWSSFLQLSSTGQYSAVTLHYYPGK